MTEKSKTRSPQEIKQIIANVRRTKTHDIKILDLKQQELELITQLRKFETDHNIVDDNSKPEYGKLQEYHDLVDKYKDVQLKYKNIELKDAIQQIEERLSGTDKLISEMSRGIQDSIVEEAKKETEEGK